MADLQSLPFQFSDQVVARYPGIDIARDFQVNWGWGIRPDIHKIETTINHPPSGDYETLSLIGLKSGKRLNLPYCRVQKISQPGPGRIEVWFEDRRWMWATGAIDGDYNYFDPLTLKYRRPVTARRLAALCLEAMREINFDVSALPFNSYPRRQWNSDNPAIELERLALEYGLVVCLDPITDRVRLCRIGQGANAPDGPAVSRFPFITRPPMPSELRIVGSSALWQSAFRLGQPLAREIDGRLVPLDDVSYTPAGGWANQSPWSFAGIQGSTVFNGERVFHRDLAQESVWRYYELDAPSAGISPEPLVGLPIEPKSMADMGPFMDCRLEKDPLTDSRLPILFRGVCFVESQESANKSVSGEWTGDLRIIDPERPIVFTSKPLFRYVGAAFNPGPAQGVVVIAHAIKTEGVQIRYELRRPNSGAPTPAGPQIEYRDDIVSEYISAAARNGGLGGDAESNKERCDAQAEYYLNSIAAQLTDLPAETVQKAGLFLGARLDGAIRRLVWSGGTDVAPTTTIARNNEPNPFVIPWEQRPARVAQKIAEALARRAKADVLVWKRRAGIN